MVESAAETPTVTPDTAARDGVALVQITGLTKRFGRATVLDNVELTLVPGEIHALMGQNGSGKSTLIKILSGVYAADSGSISVGGNIMPNPTPPSELRAHDLSFVHQDLGLIGDMSVLENIRVGRYQPSRFTRKITWSRERELAEATLHRLGSPIDVDRQVSSLRAGQRGVVAIARALQGQRLGAGCIVFDESTQSLPRETLPGFYDILRAIARSGTAILIVSHRLEEVIGLADRVTVLRDGRMAARGRRVVDLTEASLSHLILGRELTGGPLRASSERQPTLGDPVLAVTDLTGQQLNGFNVEVRAGEVVGLTGATESGMDEFPELLAGHARADSGEVTVNGRTFAVSGRPLAGLQQAGLAVIPQHRLDDGLAGDLSAVENLTLPRLGIRSPWLLSRAWQMREFAGAVQLFGIKPAAPNAAVSSFSGGNQQKLLLAKWLMNAPSVIVAHEPTQAVDVGARVDILKVLRAAAGDGKGILICSIEAQDLAAVCDRVIVLRRGERPRQLRGGLTASAITEATYA